MTAVEKAATKVVDEKAAMTTAKMGHRDGNRTKTVIRSQMWEGANMERTGVNIVPKTCHLGVGIISRGMKRLIRETRLVAVKKVVQMTSWPHEARHITLGATEAVTAVKVQSRRQPRD